jgi:xanthine dehydrogenase YagR molybdenum-binding subunit
VLSRFVGGAFGSRGGVTSRTAWIAIAARRLNRPVKLVATRAQGFTIATYRAETRHHVRLAASRDGKLQAVSHEGWEVTSRPSNYNVAGTGTTARLYSSPNVWTRVNIVHADRNTPGFMRAPPEMPYLFALECAMDELAVALNMDPVELRRINDAQNEPIKGLPYTSRSLVQCFEAGPPRHSAGQSASHVPPPCGMVIGRSDGDALRLPITRASAWRPLASAYRRGVAYGCKWPRRTSARAPIPSSP